MAIRTPRQLAIRFRQNAVDCENVARDSLRPEHDARLLKMAEHYRMLANKIDEPGGRWEAVLKSYGLSPGLA